MQTKVIVRTLHIEYDFSFKVFFLHYHSLPRLLSTIQRQQIAVIFSLSLPLWATLGENCLVSVQRDCNWSVGPRIPSDESDAIVAGCLYMYLAEYLSGYLGIFLFLVVGFRPRFHSGHLTPPGLSCLKRQTTV